ncbi:unnamed protein product [Heligmosomoides polygyrus]|uniref:Reverse transcriptase domain-containing protein n=1 Tax=Heligmosomoides polygyrus TaxID=6339 RepID=A0A183GLH3_HELPZ|nr:unnamed protein product [Heligmosomoides polygyrus]
MSTSAMATARDAHREPSHRCALPRRCSGREYTIGLTFVHLRMAFDTVETVAVIKALVTQGVEQWIRDKDFAFFGIS